VSYDAGSSPTSVAVGDFNGDGKADLAVTITGGVEVFLGNGDGTFQTPTKVYAAGTGPQSVAVGDFNGDGKADLVVANFLTSGTISVFLGNGDGTFHSAVNYNVQDQPASVAVGDFNGDGIPDLAVANNGSDTFTILLGKGDGTFNLPTSFNTFGPGYPNSIGVGDFNLDGIPDLAIAEQNGEVVIFAGSGNGSFYLFTSQNAYAPQSLVVADFNGDGLPDVGYASFYFFGVLLNSGVVGTSFTGYSFTAGSDLRWIAQGDFNGDGKPDVVVVNGGSDNVSIFLGKGDGTFQPAVDYGTGSYPYSAAVGDFNGDGVADIAVVTYLDSKLNIMLGTPPAPSTTALNSSTNPSLPGQSITLTASVLPSSATGTVSFFNGNTNLGSAEIVDGVAAISLSNLPAGADSLTAVYSGNSTLASSVGSFNQTVECSDIPSSAIAVDSNGGPQTIAVATVSPSCAWTASSSVPWIVLSATSGVGTGQLVATIAPNTSGEDQTGTISFNAQSITVTQRFTAQVFADVPPADYYFDAVNLLSTKDITSGCSSTPLDYCPNENIPRNQMAVFIVRAVYGGDNFTYSSTPWFTDVGPSDFGFAWIQKMYELGITAGCGNQMFCPNETVTRDQMAVFIIRARYGASTVFTYPAAPYFTDVATGYWAFPWIQRMREDGITAGCNATQYCPGNPVTRGDMAIFVMRGEFNALESLGVPVIASISPNALTHGTTATFTVTGANTSFEQGLTTVVPPASSGVTVNSITVTSPTSMQVSLTAAANALLQPMSIYVQTEPQEAVLPNGLTVQ
jgi:hypothetical protein